VHRPAHAIAAILSLVCFAALTAVLFAADARADDPAAMKQAEARRKKAIEEDALSMNYPAAIKDLRAAIEGCDRDRCGATLKGSLFRDLGAMQMLAGFVEDGRASFAQALSYDASLELDPAYKNPMLDGLWNDAKRKSGAAAGGTGGAPPSPKPAPPPPSGESPDQATAPASESSAPTAQPTGEFVHTPPSEHPVRTPLAVYVECKVGADGHTGNCDDYVYLGTDKLSHVVLKYKSASMQDYKPLDLQKMGAGYGGLIPCADVTQGTMKYYVQGYSEANDPIAATGSRSKPFTVPVKPQIAGPAVSLPGQPPPERCSEAGPVECPPDFPGCHPSKRVGGQSCEMNSECKSNSCIGGLCIDKKEEGEDCDTDSECASGSCKEDKCLGGAPPESESESGPSGPKVWIGVTGAIDFLVVPAADNACALNAMGTATINTAGYNCIDPSSGNPFPPDGPTNAAIANAGIVGGGITRGNVRLLASIDFELRKHLLLGARAGYVIGTIPGSVPGPAFPPIHLEARLTWIFDGEGPPHRLAPEVFVAAGAGEFDAFVPSAVRLTGQTTSQTENAWITAGPGFGAVGGGLRLLLGPRAALTAAVKGEAAVGGTAGSLFGIAPELGVQFGL
jgi:hypothetical protein